jgi:high-affinity iron transporter
MLSPFVILFREVLEVALILGVLMAATTGCARRGRWIWGGLGLGIAGSLVVAYFAEAVSSAMEGMGQELFNALILIAAAGLIGWTVIWMSRYGRTLTQHFQAVGRSVSEGCQPVYTLTMVVALATLREGSEIVLFLYGILAAGERPLSLAVGGFLGLLAGALTGAALYFGLVKISPRHLFGVTSWLLIFLAAGMVSQALGFLSAGNFIPEMMPAVYDASGFLPERGFIGRILHIFFGYSERPSGMQLIGYLTTIGGIFFIMKAKRPAGFSTDKKKPMLPVLLLVSGALLAMASPAEATNKVYSPIVEQGELEIEARGGYDFDHEDSKDGAQKQKYAAGYGVTDRWFTELYGEIEKGAEDVADREFEFTEIEWENRVQLFDQGQYWIDAGLYFAHAWSFEESHADNIEGKLLLEKQLGDFVHTANLILEKQVGGGPKAQLEGGLAWSSRYRWKPFLEPGVEYHADFGEFQADNSFDQQKHQLGPVFTGRIGDHVKYDVGYLFGLSDAAPDGRLKWIIEFEWRF